MFASRTVLTILFLQVNDDGAVKTNVHLRTVRAEPTHNERSSASIATGPATYHDNVPLRDKQPTAGEQVRLYHHFVVLLLLLLGLSAKILGAPTPMCLEVGNL
ncbi:hypothetical protein Aduo_012743 [Ancylostoma duodenale]